MEGQIEAMFRTEAEGVAPEQVPETIVETTPEAPIAEPEVQPEAQSSSLHRSRFRGRSAQGRTSHSARDLPRSARRKKQLKRRLAEFEASTANAAAPSPFDDPDAFAGYFQRN
jgi:hypothetical protein